MSGQIRAILWAQFRVVRNFLPRTSWGSFAVWLFSALWYGTYAVTSIGLSMWLRGVPPGKLRPLLSIVLICVFLFWQLFPLMTLSGGWSIELNKLLVYPIRQRTMFAMEVLLRITNAPEMIIILCGVLVGLLRNSRVPFEAALLLLLYIPFNLFFCVAMRGLVTRMLSRKRLKELVLVFFLTISILPSLVANTSLGERLGPVALQTAQAPGTPWSAFASLAIGQHILSQLLLAAVWIAAACLWANREFARTLSAEHTGFQASKPAKMPRDRAGESRPVLFRLPAVLFRDPLAALIEKEMLILSRSPRFRLIFAMACLFSVVIFFPLAFGRAHSATVSRNFLPFVSGYGLLIVGETLLWNCFGFDRKAAQLYFVSPIALKVVFRAKNMVAAIVIGFMTLIISVLGTLIGRNYNAGEILSTFLIMAVLTIFFVAFGNYTSVAMPRPIDPNQALKNQNNAKASALLLLCAAILALPLGLAMLAKWAFEARWPYFGVLVADLVTAIIIYSIATESAVNRAERDREKMIQLLSQDSKPIES